MKVLVRINQFHKFIAMTLNKGDDADIALVLHANNVVNKMIQMLRKEVKVTEVKGMTIVQAYKLQNDNPGKSPDDVIITSQLDDEFKPAQ
jgi:hypothetical protein